MSFKILFQSVTLIVAIAICQAQVVSLDPCYSSPCLVNAICNSTETFSNYTCECQDGFIGDGKINCSGICSPDPCQPYQTCHTNPDYSTFSSATPYICSCEAPYYISQGVCCSRTCPKTHTTIPSVTSPDKAKFQTDKTPECYPHCTYLSFVCPLGYISYQDPPSCIAFNACEPFNPCGGDVCNSNGTSNYTCECASGLVKDDDGVCVDEDECETQSLCDDLSTGTICTNTIGGYECSCDSSLSIPVKGDHGMTVCIALDSCSVNNGGCQQNCENSANGTICSCVDGFIQNGSFCKLDEKSTQVHCNKSCSSNHTIAAGVCLNETCQCFSGYVLKGGICVPEYSCHDINDDCYFGFQCENTLTRPGYTCNCSSSFRTGPDGRCYDYNECQSESHNCDDNATCINTNGGYQCQCNTGFTGNGTVCTELPDVCLQQYANENCMTAGETCRQKSPGVPDCYCAIPSTLVGDDDNGYVCTTPDSPLYIYDLSMQLVGNYGQDSYEARRLLEQQFLSDFFPYVISTPVLNLEVTEYSLIGVQKIKVTVKLLFNQEMLYLKNLLMEICSPYSYIAGSCILPVNFVTYNESINISDKTNNTICKNWQTCGENAVCTILDHDYQCDCLPQYIANGYASSRKPICVDRNECLDNPSICASPTQMCINLPGNYTCACLPCFVWDSSHSDCMFVCQDNPCQNNGYCQPIMAGDICSYGCTCSENFFGPNCELYNSALHVAKNNEAIIGGVLGGLLLIMIGIAIFLVYKIQTRKFEMKSI